MSSYTTTTPKRSLSFKSKLLFTASSFITSFAYRPDGSVRRFLLNLADIHTRPSTTPVNNVTSSDHIVDSSRQLWFRLFVPLHSTADHILLPVIVFFHGGGFVHYSPSTTPFHVLCRRFAEKCNAVVVSVNYRLAPEHKFPAQYDDGFDLVKFLDAEVRDKVNEFPACANLQQCFLAGDSAGGNIAHHVAVRCVGYDFKEVRIRGLVMIQPFFGGEVRTESETRLGSGGLLTLSKTDFFWKAFLPSGSDRDHPAVNVFGSGSSDEEGISGIEYPKTLVVVGGLDLLQDRQRSYADGLKRSGKEVEVVEYSDSGHGFYATTEFPEFKLLIAHVAEFVGKHAQ